MHRPHHHGLFVLTAVCTLAFVLAVIPRTAIPAKADDSQNVSIADAMAQAQQSGQPVLATAETTESSSVVANPDGTLTATLGAGPLQEPDPGSPTGWSPIDLALEHVDGTYAPQVSAADTSFSDGGAGALASLSDGTKTYTEEWGSSLPTPEVSGTTATYPNVLPGIDLVMQAQTAGFKQSFLVKAPPSQQLTLDVPLSLRGLSATVAEDGTLIVTDAHGTTVATSGTAVMYGAALDSSGEPTISATVETAIVNVGGTPVFRITPDQSFFANPELAYPVTIDPSPNLSVSTDTYVKSTTPTTSYIGDNGLKVGTPDGTEVDRALLQFPTLDATYRGNSNPIDVTSATLDLYEADSGTCTASEIDLYQVTSSWVTAGGATWNTKPSTGTEYASASFAAGHSGSCPAASETISTGGASGHSLKDLVQDWADGTSTNYGLELMAPNETTNAGYKKFRSSEYGSNPPTLSVTYDTLPDVPTSLSTTGADGSSPTLHAKFSDPDGGNGSVTYTILDDTGAPMTSGTGTTVASGNDSPFVFSPSGFTSGGTYSWTATASDGTEISSATDEQSFVFGANDCDQTNDPYQETSSFLTACGFTVSSLDSTEALSDGGTGYKYTVDGQSVEILVPPATLDLTTASSTEQDLYAYDPAVGGPSPTFDTPPSFLISGPIGTSGNSTNWADWHDTSGSSSAYSYVQSGWTEPSTSNNCSGAGEFTWGGIGGLNSSSLGQNGTVLGYPGVAAHQAWWEVLPALPVFVNLKATAGRGFSISTLWRSGSPTHYTFSWLNQYTNKKLTINVNRSSSYYDGSSAETVLERLGNHNLANFNVWHVLWSEDTGGYTGDGKDILVNGNGQQMAVPGNIHSPDGHFDVTYVRCN